MLLNRNVIKSNNIFFLMKLILGPKYSAFHGIFVHVIHAICAPLVPYSLKIYSPFMASSPPSVGRALYRESGPSQDGDPVPGNLPFFVFYFYSFFFNVIFGRFFSFPSLYEN